MALDITTQDIIVDETIGLTDTGLADDDISSSSNTALQYLLTLGTALEFAAAPHPLGWVQ
ncbi:hypothetical protein FJ546_08460 [Mesorhizobium sp. B2-4-19]|uniref:hypothetical protein n=1 Tax=Mesorhizobium sp. B2-4-19 TaxID=2589930 RepID=UPI00112E91CC|nr:hypothetical protein [Mesorhizobium sp. B2-4-19]TPK65240.1 hypothetical protein FJ546_08460 [Mesorhizobium sp. B2-4-19]